LQEQEHHDDDQQHCLDQCLDDFLDRQFDEGRRVAREYDPVAVGQVGRQRRHPRLDQFRGLERIGPRRQLQRHARRWMTVQLGRSSIAFIAQFHPRDVGQMDDGPVALRLDDDVAELLGRLQPRPRRDRRVELLPGRGGISADLPGGHFDILRGDRALHVGRHQLDGGQLVGVEPDPHRILRSEYLGRSHAVDPRDRILEMIDQIIGNVGLRSPVGLIIKANQHQEVGLRLGDRQSLLLHGVGQATERLLHLVLHLHLRRVRVGALHERHRDRRTPGRGG